MSLRPRPGPTLLGVVALLLFYWAISLFALDTVPRVYQDEPWQASTGWKLAQEGIFGSDMFAGFYGMERRYYGYLPIHPFLLALTFRVAGLGLFQDRFETVVLGALVLALTFSLAQRLFRQPAVGLLTVLFLLSVRLLGTTPSQITGIPFLDFARIARYDMAVPLFGLLALHLFWGASQSRSPTSLRRYALAGLLAGLAALSHLYGLFWLAILGLLALWNRAGWRALMLLGGGFALPWLPYIAYLLDDLPAWVGQTSDYGPRFELDNPAWYWSNLLRERHRYGPGLGPLGWGWLLRPGFWVALALLPPAFLALIWRARHDQAARTLIVPALLFPLLFALLIYLKLPNYLVAYVMFAALAAAWLTLRLWERGSHFGRALLLAALLAVLAEGGSRIALLGRVAATTTPFRAWTAAIRVHVRPGQRVLGLQDFWLAFPDIDYRAWFVPLLQADPHYWSPPRPIAEALDEINPDLILIDPAIQSFLARTDDPRPAAIREWMASRGYERQSVVDDPTYGRVEIFARPEGGEP